MTDMIAYFCKKKEGHFWAKTDPFCPLFAPFLRISIPAGYPAFALRRRVKWLEKRGIRRYIADRELFPPKALEAYGLKEVDPLPLCRAKAAQLALALLPQAPYLCRVSIGGERVDQTAIALAEALCPQVGTLYLDFDRGGEDLALHLRAAFGAAPQPPGRTPHLAVELSHRKPLGERTLRLWGEPDLLGLSLTVPGGLPGRPDPLRHLTILWESGRCALSQISVCPAGEETGNP